MNKIKNGVAPIYARITVDSRRVDISMKRTINPEEWNIARGEAKERVKKSGLLLPGIAIARSSR